MPKRLAVLLPLMVLAAGAALTAGCDAARNTLEDGLSQPDPISVVQISGDSGNVTVVGDGTTGVEVTRTARYATVKPKDTMSVASGTLNLDTDCGPQCSASYEVHVSRGVRITGSNDSGNISVRGVSTVDVEVSSGRVTVEDATGFVTVRADSGNVELSNVAGTVMVTVSSGNIDARDLRGAQNTLEADSGNIDVSLPGTGNLTARADSGNIRVRLPDRCCRILTSVDSGNTDVAVQQDPQSTHVVDLTVDSGNIEIRPA
jgi:DUF4097 and DUF4098 domain-containing protein YvlB